MKIIIWWILFFSVSDLFAQSEKNLVYRDTINIRGYIFDNLGKPVKYLRIVSSQLETEYNHFKASASTDSTGYFDLRGAKFNDTLTLAKNILYGTLKYYNKGSRYMILYLPAVRELDPNSPIEIVQTRRYPKITPAFKIEPLSSIGLQMDVGRLPHFPGGNAEFNNYIKTHITYPERAVDNNIEGMVLIGFKIEKDGSIVNLKVLRGIGYDCEQVIINVLRNCPAWKPAIDNGRPVSMMGTVAVNFRLTDK